MTKTSIVDYLEQSGRYINFDRAHMMRKCKAYLEKAYNDTFDWLEKREKENKAMNSYTARYTVKSDNCEDYEATVRTTHWATDLLKVIAEEEGYIFTDNAVVWLTSFDHCELYNTEGDKLMVEVEGKVITCREAKLDEYAWVLYIDGFVEKKSDNPKEVYDMMNMCLQDDCRERCEAQMYHYGMLWL